MRFKICSQPHIVGALPSLGLHFNVIGPEEASKLEEVFTKKEIWATISELNGDKAPGTDGFLIAFKSFCWEFHD